MKTYFIDHISAADIKKYRERSVRAINGIRLLYNEPSIIVNKPTIYGKYLTIAKYIGLTTENNKSAYNYFVPINTDIFFLLRLSDHDNKNPSLYDEHEKMGRPNRRQIICFSDGEIEPKDEEWNGSTHVVVPYGINALDNEESVISFLNALVRLFYDGDSSFPILPLVNNNNDESSNDVVHDWNKTVDKITENKQDTNMKTENKNVVRLTESKLKQIVTESVREVLKEKYNVTNMTKGDWDERDATIDTVTDWEDEEDRSEIQKWGGTFVDAITSVDKHLKLAKTNIENLFNGNNEEENGFYNGNDSESDYRYINHVEKCIDNARSALLRLRNRRLMYRGLD